MDTLPRTVERNGFVIVPRATCISCHSHSGPEFSLSNIRGPSDIHRSGIVPTGTEKDLAESYIEYAKSQRSRLDQEMSLLKQSLDALEKYRDALDRFENQERSLFSPIRKLPEDVLRYIFLQAKLHLDIDDRTDIDAQDDVVRIVTQVSVHWRKVAQSCTFLWSNVYRNYHGFPSTKAKNRALAFLENCVLFSGEAPFSVFLPDQDWTPDFVGDRCVQALASCAHRWHEIIIRSEKLLFAIFNKIPPHASFEQLVSLEIFNTSYPISLAPSPRLIKLTLRRITDPTAKVNLQYSPSLTRLGLHDVVNPTSILDGFFDWSRITHFEPHGNDYLLDEFPTFLQKMPDLVYLSFWGSLGSQLPIALPYLEELKLTCISESDIFNVLTTPKLKVLNIVECEQTKLWNARELVRRSGCSIETLKLRNVDREVWTEPEFSSVRIIHWDGPSCLMEVIRCLTITKRGTTYNFPRLEHITMEGLWPNDFEELEYDDSEDEDGDDEDSEDEDSEGVEGEDSEDEESDEVADGEIQDLGGGDDEVSDSLQESSDEENEDEDSLDEESDDEESEDDEDSEGEDTTMAGMLIAMIKSRLPPVSSSRRGTVIPAEEYLLKSVDISFEWTLMGEPKQRIIRFVQSDVVRRSGVEITVRLGDCTVSTN